MNKKITLLLFLCIQKTETMEQHNNEKALTQLRAEIRHGDIDDFQITFEKNRNHLSSTEYQSLQSFINQEVDDAQSPYNQGYRKGAGVFNLSCGFLLLFYDLYTIDLDANSVNYNEPNHKVNLSQYLITGTTAMLLISKGFRQLTGEHIKKLKYFQHKIDEKKNS